MSHKPTAYVKVEDCCCGVVHRMKQVTWENYLRSVGGKKPVVPVGGGLAAWYVPRLFIACHGVKAAELAGLAKLYGWEEVRP